MTAVTTISPTQQITDERRKWFGEWFADHRATLTTYTTPDGRALEALTWKKPGSSFYRLDFLCDGPHLIVTGDMDDAIYEAGAKNLAWWAQCDADYFHGKCIASPHGRRPKDWDERKARHDIEYSIDENGEDHSRAAKARRAEWGEYDGAEALHSRETWHDWLTSNASHVFGANWADFELWSVGAIRSVFVEAHLFALKMALQQLATPAPAERATAEPGRAEGPDQ